MIVFDLTCAHGHCFEGWFASADDFERQAKAVMVRCPVCDDASVVRVPSAKVHVGRATVDAPRVADESAAETVAGLPEDLVRKLREIVRNTENVGRRFPEEARKIHYEEVPPRPIRGQASKDDADALREEGIDFAALPPFLTRDHH
jgi:hypothetical protein